MAKVAIKPVISGMTTKNIIESFHFFFQAVLHFPILNIPEEKQVDHMLLLLGEEGLQQFYSWTFENGANFLLIFAYRNTLILRILMTFCQGAVCMQQKNNINFEIKKKWRSDWSDYHWNETSWVTKTTPLKTKCCLYKKLCIYAEYMKLWYITRQFADI